MAGINHEAVKAFGEKGLHTEWNADHVQTGNHDCGKYQHLNHVIENRTSWPAGPVAGQIVYRTDYNDAYVWNGTLWQSLTPTATIVVAADGSGHTTDIQTGIDLLPAGGGVVMIKEGTYTISVKININKDNVSIVGAGHSTIITNSVNTTNLIDVGVGIDYFTLEGVVLSPNVFLGGTGCVLEFSGASTRSRVSGCWFDAWEPRGIGFAGAGEGIIVENCVFEEVTGAGPNYGILVSQTSHIYIRGNFFYGSTNVYGVQVVGATSKYVSIMDNKFYNCHIPISVIGQEEVTIIGNFIVGFTYGIWLSGAANNIISGNKIEWGTAGILLEGGSDYNVMGNNRIINCDWGVVVNGAVEDKNLIVGNGLVGNTVATLNNGTGTEIAHNTT